jgi:hypothetical protein
MTGKIGFEKALGFFRTLDGKTLSALFRSPPFLKGDLGAILFT